MTSKKSTTMEDKNSTNENFSVSSYSLLKVLTKIDGHKNSQGVPYTGTVTLVENEWIQNSTPLVQDYNSTLTESLPGFGVQNNFLYKYIQFDSETDMPIVNKTICSIPNGIAVGPAGWKVPKEIYFSLYKLGDDSEKPWKNPIRFSNKLKRYRATIGPDFSVYARLSVIVQRDNIFKNKFLTALWQRLGLTIIPNVSWTYKDYKSSFAGWPQDSIIAVNSTGVGKNPRSRRLWLIGYNKMLEALHPIHILRYGPKIKGEREDISTYYANNNKTSATHGRK